MKQVFQIHIKSFCRATNEILGVANPSFLNEEDVLETINNCIVKFEVTKILEVSDFQFMKGEMGEKTYAYFTFVKLESASERNFFKALKLFGF